jgi:DNA-binding winged helix-turn-helix (wHTH) protein/Tol biopolymer transport system component
MSSDTKYLYEFGDFQLDPCERLLLRNGVSVSLPPKAFATLVLLVERSGRVCDKQELIRAVWPETFVEENNLTQCISTLRKTLGDNGNGQGFIETVPRLGYRFVGAARRPAVDIAATEVASARHTHARVVIREEEELEEDLPEVVPERAPESAPSISVVVRQAPARDQATFLRRHRVLLMAVAVSLLPATLLYLWLQPTAQPRVLDSAPIGQTVGATGALFSDGVDLYFSETTPLGDRLAQVPILGGEPVFVPGLAANALTPYDLSPTRPEMLVRGGPNTTAEPDLWIAPLAGGSRRQVGTVRAHDAGWSPDGESIVYANENTIGIVQRDGSFARTLVQLPEPPHSPRWSPDGRWIWFVLHRSDSDSDSLWEVAPDGTHLHSLVSFASHARMSWGNWTSDSKYLVFNLSDGRRSDLWTLPESSTTFPRRTPAPVRLTHGPVNFTAPVPARDSNRLFALGVLGRVELLRYDSKLRSFARFLQGVSADSLAFSRDKQWVAYSTYPERTLWRSRLDGTERVQLTFAPMESLLPNWSSDGKTIAFMAHLPGQPWRIETVPAEGGSAQALPGSDGRDDQGSPAWSPDGTKLIYAGVPWQHGFAPGSTALYSFDLRTRQITTLPESQNLWAPRWSPNGQFIVAETLDSMGLQIFDSQSQQWSPLARVTDAILGYSVWSKDSKYVYFNAYGEKTNSVYRVSMEKVHKTDPVLDLKGFDHIDTLGQWFSLAPDDSLLVVRDTSIRQIYSLDVKFP